MPNPTSSTPTMPHAGLIERALANAVSRQPITPSPFCGCGPTPNLSEQHVFGAPRKIRQQHVVSTLSQRRSAVTWMMVDVESNGQQGLFARTVRNFPHFFPSTYKANISKASGWWRTRSAIMELHDGRVRLGSMTGRARRGRRRHNVKALAGRGRKRAVWVMALHAALMTEFERVKAAGVKTNAEVLRHIAIALVETADSNSPFAPHIKVDGFDIACKLTARWIQEFMESHNLVIRRQTGKLAVSPEKQCYIEKSVAFHLGTLKRGFEAGDLDEDLIENADETHFVFNMDNGRTIGMRGDENVKYADVVSGDEGITMMVRITGGPHARIEAPMLVFQNANSSYPIRGVPDSVPGVSYRSGPKGWMDNRVFKEWMSEPRAISCLPNGKKCTLFVGNCSGHNGNSDVDECLRVIHTELRKLPPNTTDLVQPADSFIVSKIKDAWRREWDKYKAGEIARGSWTGSGKGSSGKLMNPGKHFFLKLAAGAVREVNHQRDKEGLSYARKAMIRTGRSLNLNGILEEEQLFTELQSIIAKHRNHFDGEPIE